MPNRVSADKGFRFPSPGYVSLAFVPPIMLDSSQPQPVMPELPDVNPATALAKNPYWKRASKVEPAIVMSGEELQKLADQLQIKPGEAPPTVGATAKWQKVAEIH